MLLTLGPSVEISVRDQDASVFSPTRPTVLHRTRPRHRSYVDASPPPAAGPHASAPRTPHTALERVRTGPVTRAVGARSPAREGLWDSGRPPGLHQGDGGCIDDVVVTRRLECLCWYRCYVHLLYVVV